MVQILTIRDCLYGNILRAKKLPLLMKNEVFVHVSGQAGRVSRSPDSIKTSHNSSHF